MTEKQSVNARMKALRANLRFFQMQVRMDIRNRRLAEAKVKEIAAEMRKLQAEIKRRKNEKAR